MRQKNGKKKVADFLDLFPILRKSDGIVRDQFEISAKFSNIPPDKILCREGDACKYFALVISGSIRVFYTTPDGDEVTYYRVKKGDSCVLTASCLMNGTAFHAIAITEDNVQALVISSAVIQEWTQKFDVWNEYILSSLAGKMCKIAGTMAHINFCSLDCRIATVILEKSTGKKNIKITHNEIVLEIGSAREAVSRILKNFEKKNFIKMTRNRIEILNPSGLTECTEIC